MKKVLCLLLALSLLACFAACAEKEEAGEVYYLYELTDGNETISASQLAAEMQAEGLILNEMYYLRLYENGSGVMCSNGEEIQIKRDTTHIWPVNDENAKMPFTREGDMLTLQDGDVTIVFKKG